MKKYISLLIVFAMLMTTFAGFSAVAAEKKFIIYFDAFPGGKAESSANNVFTKEFSYSQGETVSMAGWFGGTFAKTGTTMFYKIDDGAENSIGVSPVADDAPIASAVKGSVPDATLWASFSADFTEALNSSYNNKSQVIKVYAKDADGTEVQMAQFTTKLDTLVEMTKKTFYEGDPIEVSYKNADKSRNDWLAIYKDVEGEQPAYGGGYESVQYAYIDGTGKVIFNDPEKKVPENDRTSYSTNKGIEGHGDYPYNELDKIFYNDSELPLDTLPAGKYHVVILGNPGFYTVCSNTMHFEVVSKDYITGDNGNHTVNLSSLEGASQSYGAHGYPDLVSKLLNGANLTELGYFDLSDFKAIEITYATDPGYKASNENIFGLLNKGEQNKDNVIASGAITDAVITNPDGTNWDKAERKCTIDLSGVDNKELLWLSAFNITGQILLVNIEFIAGKAEAPHEHTWGDWTQTKAPTCTEPGEETRTCTGDETHTEKREVAALGHSFTNYVYNNDATKEADGTETAVCDNGCGTKYTRTKAGTKLPADVDGPDNPGSDKNPETGSAEMWIVAAVLISVIGAAVICCRKKLQA